MAENEKVYLEEGGVIVTKARFIVPAQTHTMSGITSVKAAVDQPLKGPAILGGIGVLMMFAGEVGAVIFGLLLIAGAILWFIKGKKHIVVLNSASGEAKAISSNNSSFIGRIIAALNEAIVDRG